jgi:FAD/FMN-containing dehydrogenase
MSEDTATLPAPVARVLDEIGDCEITTEARLVKRRSRDFFWYSPVLDKQLNGLAADAIVRPRDEDELVRLAAAAARHRVPLTPRGGATGNYGQMVPLKGGLLVDMTAFSDVARPTSGVARLGAGGKMHDIDAALRPFGWEQRLHPSTKRTATVGGFVAGGSGGIGSVTYGGLRERGNILAARVVTVEERPRILDLAGDAAQKINRAYGTTGLVTRLDMPLAPAYDWIEMVIAADDFAAAFALARDLALADGVVKKLVSLIDWPIPAYFGPLAAVCPPGKPVILAMVAEASRQSTRDLVAGRGEITLERPATEEPGTVPLYEYAWNHTTLQWLKTDRSITYLQCLYPHDRLEETVFGFRDRFGDEVIPHLEFIRFAGRPTASALPVVRYASPERLDAIIAAFEAGGVLIANPHVYTLEDGSRHKRADADQLGFKADVDPYGLLNPGKMRSYVPVLA